MPRPSNGFGLGLPPRDGFENSPSDSNTYRWRCNMNLPLWNLRLICSNNISLVDPFVDVDPPYSMHSDQCFPLLDDRCE